MSRDNIHNRIDELLGLLSIHNSRLSLHVEKISQLDIDVLRKQCIDLYDEVNKLALKGKITVKRQEPKPEVSEVVQKPVEVIAKPEIKHVVIEPIVSETPKEVKPAQPIIEKEPIKVVKPKPVKKKHKSQPDDEMLSLFEKFSSKPIESIPRSISVAKRFEFQAELFEGDASMYKSFMSDLDSAGGREEAFEIYHDHKTKLNWENEELKDELKALMYRKYSD